ncbi:MAG TPA: acyl carrier protein [Labilithrix sp.]|nr:acyl carrier protein [Labilithrix sp.]
MNSADIERAVLHSLKAVAPEADLSTLGRSEDLRDALDIDSMDFLRFVVGLHNTLHVEVPERDYPKIRTLDTCVAYLERKLAT